MKVLLDESIDVRFRSRLVGHDAFTVSFMGWKSLKNGSLLRAAVANNFDVIVTTDRAMAAQLNLQGLPISIAILYGTTNKLADLDPLVPELLNALSNPRAGTFIHVRP